MEDNYQNTIESVIEYRNVLKWKLELDVVYENEEVQILILQILTLIIGVHCNAT
jgi:hypothetical protein